MLSESTPIDVDQGYNAGWMTSIGRGHDCGVMISDATEVILDCRRLIGNTIGDLEMMKREWSILCAFSETAACHRVLGGE